jgi:colanic acid biosynthesis glycosyl transferase WcaI
MNILVYATNFSPEMAGSARLNTELLEWFAVNNHKVDLITSMPFYPEWKIHPEYRNKWWFVENRGNLRVFRTPLYVPQKVSPLKRIAHELSFGFSSLINWAKIFSNDYDIILSICPPLQMGILPTLFCKLKSIKSVFFIHDLQVDAALNLNMIKSSFLIKSLTYIEKKILENSDLVVSLSHGMNNKILSKKAKIKESYILNLWTDTKKVVPLSAEQSFRHEWGFDINDFIILYAGNIGEKQGIEVIIDAAIKLIYNKRIKFIICGNGANKNNLINYSNSKNVSNVYFKDLIPHYNISKLLATADIHLVPQKRAAADLLLPSKYTDILASGGVALVSAEEGTSLYDITVSNNCGIVISPEDSLALVAAIEQVIHQDLTKIRLNAREYAEKVLDKENNFKRFENHLLTILK